MSLEHYRCQLIFAKDTKAVQVSDTVDFRLHHLTQTTLTHADRILHSIYTLSCALTDAPTVFCDAQLRDIIELRDIFQRWYDPSQLSTVPPQTIHHKTQSGTPNLGKGGQRRKSCLPPTPPPPRMHNPVAAIQSPRVRFSEATSPNPRVETSDSRVETFNPKGRKPPLHSQLQKDNAPEPIAQRTRLHHPPPDPMPTEPVTILTQSHTFNLVSLAQASGRCYLRQFFQLGNACT